MMKRQAADEKFIAHTAAVDVVDEEMMVKTNGGGKSKANQYMEVYGIGIDEAWQHR